MARKSPRNPDDQPPKKRKRKGSQPTPPPPEEPPSDEDVIRIVEEGGLPPQAESVPLNPVEDGPIHFVGEPEPAPEVAPVEAGLSDEDMLAILSESSIPPAEPATGDYAPLAEAPPVQATDEDEMIALVNESDELDFPKETDPPEDEPPAARRSVPTMLAGRAAQPTMLAPREELPEEPPLGLVGEPVPGLLGRSIFSDSDEPASATDDAASEEVPLGAAPVPVAGEPTTGEYQPPTGNYLPEEEDSLAEEEFSADEPAKDHVRPVAPTTSEAPGDMLTAEEVSAGFLLSEEPFEEPAQPDSPQAVAESSLDLAGLLGEKTASDSGAESALIVEPPPLDLGLDRPREPEDGPTPSSSVLSALVEPVPVSATDTPPPEPPLAKPASDVDLSKFPKLSLDESGEILEMAGDDEMVEVEAGSDSAVSLTEPPAVTLSSDSGVVVVEAGEDLDEELVELQPPSSIDVGAEALFEDEAEASPPSSSIEVTEDILVDEPPPSSGAIDVGDDALVSDEAPAPPSSSIEVTDDALVEELAASAGPPSSGIMVTGDDLVDTLENAAEPRVPETPSEILRTHAPEVEAVEADDFLDDEVLVEGGSEVSLSGRRSEERPSGIDIVEELESGVMPSARVDSFDDLDEVQDQLAGRDDLAVEHLNDPEDADSSAVDLGSSASFAIPSGLESHPLFKGEEVEEVPTKMSSRKEPVELETTQAFEATDSKKNVDLESTMAFNPREEEEASKPPRSDVATIDESLLESDEEFVMGAGEATEVTEEPSEEEEVVVSDDLLVEDEDEVEVDEEMLLGDKSGKMVVDEDLLMPEEEEAALEPELDEEFASSSDLEIGGKRAGKRAAAKSAPSKAASKRAGKRVKDEEDEDFGGDFADDFGDGDDDVEDADEPVAAGARGRGKPGRKGDKEVPRPRFFLRGTFLFLLGAGLIAGAVFASPHIPDAKKFMTQTVLGIPDAPQPQGPVGVQLTMLQKARTKMDEKEYDAAYKELTDADKAEELSARGEALWLKYLKDKTEQKAPLSLKDTEVEKALKDIRAGKNNLLEQQVTSTISSVDQKGVLDRLNLLDATDKALRDLLAKQKAVPADDPTLKNLPKAIGAIVVARAQHESKLTALAKTLNIDDPAKLTVEDVDALFKSLGAAKKTLDDVTGALKVKQDEALKTVEKWKQDLKDQGETLTKVNEKLKDAKVAKVGPDGVADLVAKRDELQTKRDALEKAIREALKELRDGSPAPPTADLVKELVQDAATAREKGRSPLINSLSTVGSSFSGLASTAESFMQQAMQRGRLEGELGLYRLREPLIQTAEQKLDTWVALFQNRDVKNPRALAQAEKDLKWILSPEAKAPPEAKARAVYLDSLLARSQQKWDESRKLLEQSIGLGNELKMKPAWMVHCTQTLQELSDPSVFYLPRAQKLQAAGDLPGALRELELGLQVLPGEQPRLLLLRSHIRLDQAQATRTIAAPDIEAITKDAEAALKDENLAASASYALGRLAEELGQFDKAEASYRAALKAHKGSSEERGTYVAALGRMLQRDRAPVAAPPANGKAKAPEVGRLSGEEEAEFAEAILLLTLVAVQPIPIVEDEEDAKTLERLKESIELAKELLKSKDAKQQAQGHLLLAKAYSRMGKRTEGLFEYLEGMRKLHPGGNTTDLAKLVEQHPAFQQPDSSLQPSPTLAEVHFGKGLHQYWNGNHESAEKQFAKAVSYFDKDARYLYFLGLAQLGQKTTVKRDAAHYSFQKGARLESQSLPTNVEINASLERIQGPLRQYLNGFRQKALAGE